MLYVKYSVILQAFSANPGRMAWVSIFTVGGLILVYSEILVRVAA